MSEYNIQLTGKLLEAAKFIFVVDWVKETIFIIRGEA